MTPTTTAYHTVTVQLAQQHYPIVIGAGLLTDPHLLATYVPGKQALIVTYENIGQWYLDKILQSLPQVACDVLYLPAGEKYKNLDTVNLIFDRLICQRHSRATTLIALGGGVIGDITGFAAACYQRGVRVIQIPTTLLAQVDSAIGGKTGVNHPLGKNMIGAFHQPHCVIADIATLATLPDREFRAGLAEVIKYALILDVNFFVWLENHLAQLLQKDRTALIHAVTRCCELKAQVVMQDEKESHLRAILNFGHTIGHAIEAATHYETWLHGESVAIGMVMAARLSVYLKKLAQADFVRIEKLLHTAGLPTELPTLLTLAELEKHIAVDKKTSDKGLKFILLNGLGRAEITTALPTNWLTQACRS